MEMNAVLDLHVLEFQAQPVIKKEKSFSGEERWSYWLAARSLGTGVGAVPELWEFAVWRFKGA